MLNCVAVLSPAGTSGICTERSRLSNNQRAFSFPRIAFCRISIECYTEIHAKRPVVVLAMQYQLNITR
jgi:hypothetical protein